MSTTVWPFIEVDETGCATIQAKGLKVLHVVREHLAFGWDAEQLHRQHPHVSLPEIHSALGYYYEHRAECDALIEREERRLEVLKSQLVNQSIQERLKLSRDKA